MESVLKTVGLKKYYGKGDTMVKALDGIDLEIERGKFTAIIGTSGSGKSTLLNMLGGLDIPTEGSIRIGTTALEKLNSEQATIFRRKQIGFIFQNYNLIHDLNGGYGPVPETQKIRWGGLLQKVQDPTRAGYNFKGWHLEENGLDHGLWDFGNPVENNTGSLHTALYAMWADEIAPVLGEASYSTGHKCSWL